MHRGITKEAQVVVRLHAGAADEPGSTTASYTRRRDLRFATAVTSLAEDMLLQRSIVAKSAACVDTPHVRLVWHLPELR